MVPEKSPADLKLAAFAMASGILGGVVYLLMLWGILGDGSLLDGRLPYWDFTNLWGGSRMTLDGNVAALFDAAAYRDALRAMLSPTLPNQEWSYPPTMLLVGTPLALLPIPIAYGLWTVGTIALLHLAIRPLRLSPIVHLTALFSPAVFMNGFFGQNGALTAALLLGGLLAAPTRPVFAGVLFGLLTLKPHLGILVPFCLLASGNWRAIASAAATAAILVILTGMAFGFAVWPAFLTETGPLMRAIMEAPYPQTYHANALTVFILARSAGADLAAAYAAQALAAAGAIAVAIWLWLPSNTVDHRWRALLTATLAIVATPYGYSYDTVPMCIAIAFAFQALKRPPLGFLGVIWLSPLIVHVANYKGFGIGILAPVCMAAWMLSVAVGSRSVEARRRQRDASSAVAERTNSVNEASR